ncbi:MAG: DNA-directed RNA polymerase subunit omega [Oscillospiraceae bacterium]|nr:DNA-directed RNA polymerase subunit omega [Oscillospiraceae bacterium]
MMLYPSVSSLLEKLNSRYYLVNVIAQRARELAQNAEECGERLDVKPVSLAIKDIDDGTVDVRDYMNKD